MQTHKLNNTNHASAEQNSQTKLPNYALFQNQDQHALLQELIEDLIDGILILTAERELIYANDSAHRILRQLHKGRTRANLVPKEIWHLCQSLIQTRSLFPNQRWLIESRIFTEHATTFNIRVRWLNLTPFENPCLLLILEDQCQAIRNIATEEAQGCGMTHREKEVWLLHRANYTYQEIALELCITPNTVKKHMKSIHAKQKENFDAINSAISRKYQDRQDK